MGVKIAISFVGTLEIGSEGIVEATIQDGEWSCPEPGLAQLLPAITSMDDLWSDEPNPDRHMAITAIAALRRMGLSAEIISQPEEPDEEEPDEFGRYRIY